MDNKKNGVLTDRQMLKTVLADLEISTTFCERCGHGEDTELYWHWARLPK